MSEGGYGAPTEREYWERRRQDDKRWQEFEQRLDRLESALGTLIGLGRWMLATLGTAVIATAADLILRGGFH